MMVKGKLFSSIRTVEQRMCCLAYARKPNRRMCVGLQNQNIWIAAALFLSFFLSCQIGCNCHHGPKSASWEKNWKCFTWWHGKCCNESARRQFNPQCQQRNRHKLLDTETLGAEGPDHWWSQQSAISTELQLPSGVQHRRRNHAQRIPAEGFKNPPWPFFQTSEETCFWVCC